MRVGLTGGTGYIGSGVGEALSAAGHEPLALAHRTGVEETFRARGWTSIPGNLRDPESLQALVRDSDAVIHAAMADGADGPAVDRAAVQAMLQALEGSGKPFVYTSGVWILGPGESDEETDPLRPLSLAEWRVPLEQEILAYASRGVRSVVLRPGIVWGRGGGIPGMLGRGEVPVVGDGSQTWPMVHVEDLADLYVRALGVPAGTILHGVHDTVTVARVADVARQEAGRTEALIHLTLEETRNAVGPFADALGLDQRVSARSTLAQTGWNPTRNVPEA